MAESGRARGRTYVDARRWVTRPNRREISKPQGATEPVGVSSCSRCICGYRYQRQPQVPTTCTTVVRREGMARVVTSRGAPTAEDEVAGRMQVALLGQIPRCRFGGWEAARREVHKNQAPSSHGEQPYHKESEEKKVGGKYGGKSVCPGAVSRLD